MKDTKLNNLISLEDFSGKMTVPAKATKRTDVAKDVLKENAYVIGKDVLSDKLKAKEVIKSKELNNLISLDDFTKETPKTGAKSTKRTEVGKDILQEKMKAKKEDCDDDCGKDFKYHTKKGKKDDDDEDDKAKTGLTAAQKRKLSPEMQAAILKRKGKK
jgi:hypothetical protein